MDSRPTWTDCDEAGDYVAPNVLSPRDRVARHDNMAETLPYIRLYYNAQYQSNVARLYHIVPRGDQTL